MKVAQGRIPNPGHLEDSALGPGPHGVYGCLRVKGDEG